MEQYYRASIEHAIKYYPWHHLCLQYISETTNVSTVYSVAAVLYLQFVLHVMLFRPWNMFCTFTIALPAVCVCSAQYGCFSWFLKFVLSRYVAQVLSAWFWNGSSHLLLLISLLLSHSICVEFLLFGLYVLKSSQLLCWTHFCLQELLHLLTCKFQFLLSRIMMSSLLLGIVLSICTCGSVIW